MTRPLYQSNESYQRTIRELERRVDAGVRLEYYDCEDIGAKNTECTLGLCHDSIKEIQDGIYGDRGHACPHDGRYFSADGIPTGVKPQLTSGCFYHCHIFQGTTKDRRLAQQRIRAVAGIVKGRCSMSERQPFYVWCKSCRHEWVAFWLPLLMDRKGMALMKSAGHAPCPMCAGKPVIVGRAPAPSEPKPAVQEIPI